MDVVAVVVISILTIVGLVGLFSLWYFGFWGEDSYDEGVRDGYRGTRHNDHHIGPNRLLYTLGRGKHSREEKRRALRNARADKRMELAKRREAQLANRQARVQAQRNAKKS